MEGITKTHSLLNPLDRAAEILFGLIMALSFTCTISIVSTERTEIRQLLFAAIDCNLAWGIVDATMYLIGVLAEKGKNKSLLNTIRQSVESDKARMHIADALPPVVASAIGTEGLEQIRNKLMAMPGGPGNPGLTIHDIKKAVAIFFLVFFSTFPVVLPFLFIHDAKTALRVSNLVAIVMMFLCGWSVAGYVGYSKWKMSLAMVVIGLILVAVTIWLGG